MATRKGSAAKDIHGTGDSAECNKNQLETMEMIYTYTGCFRGKVICKPFCCRLRESIRVWDYGDRLWLGFGWGVLLYVSYLRPDTVTR